MSSQDHPFRVAMASPIGGNNAFGSFLGVLDYKEHAEQWELVGRVQKPILAFEELDLDGLDGVIGFFRERRWADELSRAAIAAVNFSGAVEELTLPRVGNDEEAIGRLGAEHLLERGFTRFGFFGHSGVWYSRRRCAAFRGVIEGEAGRSCHVLDGRSSGETIDRRIYDWLEELPKPIGVMATNDWRAVHLIQAAVELGLRVPDDVAVLGVDNDQWLTQMPAVAMTSVEPDWRGVGYRAAQMLDELMRGETPAPQHWIQPLGVVSRGSTDILVAEDPVVGQALEFIREHCAEPISVDDVLDELGVSRRTLENRLKHAIGVTPHTAICRARVEKAKEMLIRSDASMYAIARTCGFGKPNQLFIVFKRLTGMTPGQHRQRFGKP